MRGIAAGLMALALGPLAVHAQGSPSGWDLVQERIIGSASGPLAFGLIGPIAVNDSLLAVADHTTCDLALYNVRRNSYLARWGGCGGGPGEFAQITAMAWHGDSLFVVDGPRRSISVLASGKLVRQVRPQLGREVGPIAHVGFADDSTLVLGFGLLPSFALSGTEEERHSFLALVDSRNGRLLGRHLQDGDPFSRQNQAPRGRTLPMCSSPLTVRPPAIAVLSPWEFRIRLFRLGQADTVRAAAEVTGHRRVSRGPGQWYTSGGVTSLACGDRYILFKWSRQAAREGRTGYLEVRDLRGALLLTKRLDWADSTLFGVAGASYGDRFYFKTNQVLEYPAVVVFRVVPSASRSSPRP